MGYYAYSNFDLTFPHVQAALDALKECHGWLDGEPTSIASLEQFVLAFDPTSNVFSTAAGVFTNDADLFNQALSVPAGL